MMMPITQSAFAKPPRSWLRKMSENTMISSQIQMKNKKNQSIDRNTCPVPNSLARGISSPRDDEWNENEATPTPPEGASPNRVKLCHETRERHRGANTSVTHGARGRVGHGHGASVARRPARRRDSRAHRRHDAPPSR